MLNGTSWQYKLVHACFEEAGELLLNWSLIHSAKSMQLQALLNLSKGTKPWFLCVCMAKSKFTLKNYEFEFDAL